MNMLLNGSLRLFFSRGRMPAAVLLSPWQTGSHNLRRIYCKTPLATPECWCPEERGLGAEEGARKELLGPTREHSPSLGTACDLSLLQAREASRQRPALLQLDWRQPATVSSSLCTANKPPWCTQLGQASCRYSSASFLRYQSSRANTSTEYQLSHGRRCSPAALLGDGHCPPATWWAASKSPLTPSQSARAVAMFPLTIHLSFPSSPHHSQKGKQSTSKHRLWVCGAFSAFAW